MLRFMSDLFPSHPLGHRGQRLSQTKFYDQLWLTSEKLCEGSIAVKEDKKAFMIVSL